MNPTDPSTWPLGPIAQTPATLTLALFILAALEALVILGFLLYSIGNRIERRKPDK